MYKLVLQLGHSICYVGTLEMTAERNCRTRSPAGGEWIGTGVKLLLKRRTTTELLPPASREPQGFTQRFGSRWPRAAAFSRDADSLARPS
jgi:hypothetical protein